MVGTGKQHKRVQMKLMNGHFQLMHHGRRTPMPMSSLPLCHQKERRTRRLMRRVGGEGGGDSGDSLGGDNGDNASHKCKSKDGKGSRADL